MDLGKLFSKVVKTVKDSLEAEQRQSTTAQPKPTPQPAATTHYEEKERTDSEWVAYFREILATVFPQYSVKENIAVTEVAGFATDEFKLYKSRPTQAYKAEWGQETGLSLHQLLHPDAQRTRLCHRSHPQVLELKTQEKGDAAPLRLPKEAALSFISRFCRQPDKVPSRDPQFCGFKIFPLFLFH